MSPKSKKALLVIGSFLVIGGVVAFFLIRSRKKRSEESSDTPPSTGNDASAYTQSGSGSSSSTPTEKQFNFPFKTEEEGNKFRTWVNNKYPSWAKENELSSSGKLNEYVQKAWDKFGKEYQSILSQGFKIESKPVKYVTTAVQRIYEKPDLNSNVTARTTRELLFDGNTDRLIQGANKINFFKVSLREDENTSKQRMTGYVAVRELKSYK